MRLTRSTPLNTTRADNDLQVNEDEDPSQIEIVVPSRSALDYDPTQADNQVEDDINWNMVEHNREGNEENQGLEPQRRGRGRPKILRTGIRERPRKEYHPSNFAKETEETAYIAEISLVQAIHGPDADE